MINLLNAILRPYQKIINQSHELETIPQDILMPLINISDFEKLCSYATHQFTTQNIILSITGDVYVVGDLHGNIFDLLRILKHVGDLTKSKILFLGDYVDRGEFSIEVVTLLFTLACIYPESIFLIRGNHEFRKVNEVYGFKQQIIDVFESDIPWEKANSAFDCLPLAAIVNEKIFCVHGGITPALKKITDLKSKYQRPIYTFEDEILYDLMWGDPTHSSQNYMPSLRGIGKQFGSVALHKFLSENDFNQMLRGHQSVRNGVERLFKNKLVTVFSSSSYGEIADGRAGFIYVNEDLTQRDFILYPYEKVVDRKSTHFIPINTKSLNTLTHLDSLSIQQMPGPLSAARSSSSLKFSSPSARPRGKMLVSKPFVLQPAIKRNSYFNMKPTFGSPLM